MSPAFGWWDLNCIADRPVANSGVCAVSWHDRGLTLATLAAVMQFQDWSNIIPIWILFGIGQLLEGMLITPWLVGDRIGLHPVIVIFALLAFGQLFGFFGILLALPVSAVMLVWLPIFINATNSNFYH